MILFDCFLRFVFNKILFLFLAIVVRFLTRRFLPEYQSGIETVYHYKDGGDDNDIQIIDTCGNVSYCIIVLNIVLYCIVLYCIVLYCIVLYCIEMYCIEMY